MRFEDDIDSPLFMISVAAELAGMHPQTLRVYERRGLLRPQRSAKNTRRYSRRDVERLRRIQELTAMGLNLAGIERVLAMEQRLEEMTHEIDGLHARLSAAAREARRAVAEAERGHRFDLVPLRSTALVPLPRRRRPR
jgi:MerR family transcriptional regulator/heat shock protein HspR